MPVDLTNVPENIAQEIKKLSDKYSFVEAIEKASNGHVFLGTNLLLGRKIVIKFYSWAYGAQPEPKLLSELLMENILKVYDAAAIDDEWAYFVTPFCDGGDLDSVLSNGPLGPKEALEFLQQVLSGVSFLHGGGYLHRDLKPSNIFRDENGKIVIGDFGSVVKIGDQGFAQTLTRHSIIYRTPEKINEGRDYTQGDIYQLGIILYQLVGGRLSYETNDWLNGKQQQQKLNMKDDDGQIFANEIIEQLIVKGKVIDLSSLPEWCPEEIKKIIRKCCNIQREKRFQTAAELKGKILNSHPKLKDWRPDEYLTLFDGPRKFRVIVDRGTYFAEKKASENAEWRRVGKEKFKTLKDVILFVESQCRR